MPSFELGSTVTPSPTEPARRQGHRRGGHHRLHPGGDQRHRRRPRARSASPTSHAGLARNGCGQRSRRPGIDRQRRSPMIPAAFDYVRAGSADEAVSLLAEHGDDAKLLAGGHSLIPLMKLRLASPAVLIDVGRLGDLSYIRDGGDHIAIGALTRHHDIETQRRAQDRGADPGPRGRPRRRPPGPPPGHDRRVAGPRRPGLRPPGGRPRPRRDAGGPGPGRGAARSPPPTSSPASWRRPSPPTSS